MANDSGRDPLGQALAVPVEPVARLDPSGFDPSRMEYRFSIQEGRERHDWIIVGKLGAINIWAQPTRVGGFLHERWFGGIECHSATPLEYSGGKHERCWVLDAPCWHDGSSLQFSEQVEERLPAPNGKPIAGEMLDELGPLLRSRYRTWLAEPAQGIEAATADETAQTGSVHESPVAGSDAPDTGVSGLSHTGVDRG